MPHTKYSIPDFMADARKILATAQPLAEKKAAIGARPRGAEADRPVGRQARPGGLHAAATAGHPFAQQPQLSGHLRAAVTATPPLPPGERLIYDVDRQACWPSYQTGDVFTGEWPPRPEQFLASVAAPRESLARRHVDRRATVVRARLQHTYGVAGLRQSQGHDAAGAAGPDDHVVELFVHQIPRC
jgi:hypothetical protein